MFFFRLLVMVSKFTYVYERANYIKILTMSTQPLIKTALKIEQLTTTKVQTDTYTYIRKYVYLPPQNQSQPSISPQLLTCRLQVQRQSKQKEQEANMTISFSPCERKKNANRVNYIRISAIESNFLINLDQIVVIAMVGIAIIIVAAA